MIEIREAEPAADAKLISILAMVTFYEAYFEQDTPTDMAEYLTESFNLERISEEINDRDSTFFIIFRSGVAAGYAKLIRHSTTDGVAEPTVELKRIYLVERYWGSGIGKILLEHCIEAARGEGFRTIWLEVWEKNERGLRFYQKHGFSRVGTITFPYGESVGVNHVLEKKI